MARDRTIEIEQHYTAKPESVWRALTDPESLAAWLMKNDFRAEVGHEFTFRADPMPGWDGIVHCRVEAVEPEKQLIYTWMGGRGMPSTKVRWKLEGAPDGGTHLQLLHSGFRGLKPFMVSKILESGWKRMLANDLSRLLDLESGNGGNQKGQ